MDWFWLPRWRYCKSTAAPSRLLLIPGTLNMAQRPLHLYQLGYHGVLWDQQNNVIHKTLLSLLCQDEYQFNNPWVSLSSPRLCPDKRRCLRHHILHNQLFSTVQGSTRGIGIPQGRPAAAQGVPVLVVPRETNVHAHLDMTQGYTVVKVLWILKWELIPIMFLSIYMTSIMLAPEYFNGFFLTTAPLGRKALLLFITGKTGTQDEWLVWRHYWSLWQNRDLKPSFSHPILPVLPFLSMARYRHFYTTFIGISDWIPVYTHNRIDAWYRLV